MAVKVLLATSSTDRRRHFRNHFPQLVEHSRMVSPGIDEKAIRDPDPETLVKKIASAKCDAVLKKDELCLDADVVVTSDLVCVFKDKVREKPVDRNEARSFLCDYRSSPDDRFWAFQALVAHRVDNGTRVVHFDKGWGRFNHYPDSVIEEYIDKGDAMSCAGAFNNCNDLIGKYIDVIAGTNDSMVGFPVKCLRDSLMKLFPDSAPMFKQVSYCEQGKPIKCVIFDMDGLLLDTESYYTVVAQNILDRFGLKFNWEIKSRMMGRKALDAANLMVDYYNIGDKITAEEFVKEREEALDKLFPESDLLPGVERLLLHLFKNGIPMAIATGSHKRHFLLKSAKHRDLFTKVFTHIVTSDTVKEAKPHPEIFESALEKFHFQSTLDRDEVLVFEDSPLGVEAGLNAKMKVVMVNYHREPKDNLKPTQYIRSLYEFFPEQWGLPQFSQDV